MNYKKIADKYKEGDGILVEKFAEQLENPSVENHLQLLTYRLELLGGAFLTMLEVLDE